VAWLIVVAAATAGLLAVGFGWEPAPRPGEVPAAVLAEGKVLYSEHCASCHGRNLEGQPDWQTPLPSGRLPAPPHDASGHTWHHPDEVLFQITKHGTAAVVGGNYESDMPGFEGILTDDEIRAVLAYIKSTWPERERMYQEDRTRAWRADQ
jgi:mono/diheme cytochrome c family protein